MWPHWIKSYLYQHRVTYHHDTVPIILLRGGAGSLVISAGFMFVTRLVLTLIDLFLLDTSCRLLNFPA